ncbi:hypothetical protein TNCV_3529941 [Trichonephila clavipes]|uniref:Uncharacterized protein n=1 Tax=Trichonephila clavipes TaxID=2585209 RepID=A0A8X6RCY2_TRICX|nr:hypothetical protein TNCV_3529941 [Trichonephila clavipes]
MINEQNLCPIFYPLRFFPRYPDSIPRNTRSSYDASRHFIGKSIYSLFQLVIVAKAHFGQIFFPNVYPNVTGGYYEVPSLGFRVVRDVIFKLLQGSKGLTDNVVKEDADIFDIHA